MIASSPTDVASAAPGSAPKDVAGRFRLLKETLDLERFVSLSAAAWRRAPDDPEVGAHYAEALGHAGRVAEQRAVLEAVLARWPEHANARLVLGQSLLADGEHVAAWPHFAFRRRLPAMRAMADRPPEERRWRGEPLTGKRIAVIREQGIGDTLQFVRFAIDLQAAGARPALNVQAPLRTLLAASPALGDVLQPEAPVRLHYWTDMMDLLPTFAPTRAHLRWPGAYISPPAQTAPLAALARSHGLRVGVAWRGNPGYLYDFARSVPLNELAPLADIPGCRFFGLTLGAGAEIEDGGHGRWLTDASDLASPFENLAAVVAGLDVVVTVDTAIAHLAAAIGRPTFLLISAIPDWRWGRMGDRSPWYPSVRLYRQYRLGRWQEPVARLAADLAAL